MIDRRSPANYTDINGTVLFKTTVVNQKISVSTIGATRFNDGSGRNKGTNILIERIE